MDNPLALFKQTLKEHGQNITAARQIVFEALVGKEPQSMHELVEACGNAIDRASIYRTTTLFEQLGIVDKLQSGWKYKLELSDRFSHHHHHLTCVHCGRVIPLPEDDALENRLNDLASSANFFPKTHQIEIRGLCEHCRPA